MRISELMKYMDDRDKGKLEGRTASSRGVRDGKHIVDGVLCYDGTGSSGYTGTAHSNRVANRPAKLVPIADVPAQDRERRGGRRSRRVRRNQWVRV